MAIILQSYSLCNKWCGVVIQTSEFYSYGQIGRKSALAQVMRWHQTSGNASQEPTTNHFTNAGLLSLTWVNRNPSIDKKLYVQQNVGWNDLSVLGLIHVNKLGLGPQHVNQTTMVTIMRSIIFTIFWILNIEYHIARMWWWWITMV